MRVGDDRVGERRCITFLATRWWNEIAVSGCAEEPERHSRTSGQDQEWWRYARSGNRSRFVNLFHKQSAMKTSWIERRDRYERELHGENMQYTRIGRFPCLGKVSSTKS